MTLHLTNVANTCFFSPFLFSGMYCSIIIFTPLNTRHSFTNPIMPRTGQEALRYANIPLRDKLANGERSVIALKQHLPLPVYASLGPFHACRAHLVDVKTVDANSRSLQGTSAILKYTFNFDGQSFLAPCKLGWHMVEVARQHDNPGEDEPPSKNFDGWRRVKVVHMNSIITLDDYITPAVRYGGEVWDLSKIKKKGRHSVLMEIITQSEARVPGYHVWEKSRDASEIRALPKLPHVNRKREATQGALKPGRRTKASRDTLPDLEGDGTPLPRQRKRKRRARAEDLQPFMDEGDDCDDKDYLPNLPDLDDLDMRKRHCAVKPPILTSPSDATISMEQALTTLGPLLTMLQRLLKVATGDEAVRRIQSMRPQDLDAYSLPGDMKRVLLRVASLVRESEALLM